MKQLWLSLLLSTALLLTALWQPAVPIVHAVPENNSYQTLPLQQGWDNTLLITVNDQWGGVPGIIGYRGDDLTTATGVDPQTILSDGTSTPIDVVANQIDPNTLTDDGLAEFNIPNSVVAMQSSDIADAPFLLLHVNTTSYTNIRVRYTLRDIDGSADNAIQPIALQYRVGAFGDFTNVPAAFVADATTGPNLATQTTYVDVTLPAVVDNQAQVQLRVLTTNAAGADEWVGVDSIQVTGGRLTYHAITFDGTVNTSTEWDTTTERLGTTSTMYYYVTWDDIYLYVGLRGGDTNNDKYNLLIDTDPNDIGANNSGTRNEYCGATFGADGKPDYAIQKYPGGYDRSRAVSGSWSSWSPSGATTATNAVNQVEFRVGWSDLGMVGNRSAPLGLYLYACDNGNRVWSAWPPSNLLWTGNAQELTTRTYFHTTDSGRNPRTYAQQRGDQTAFNATGNVSLLNSFAQFNITAGGGAGCHILVRVRGNAAVDSANSAVRRLYDITPSNCPGLTADLTLKYLDGTEYEAVDELNGAIEANLHLYRWNGSAWSDEGGTSNTFNNTVTRNGVNTFSPWTFDDASPTAITLTRLEAQSPNVGPTVFLMLGSVMVVGVGVVLWKRHRA
ncbi:hypothetical protein TFLX_02077 [Thermoflexales bacterium]|nr:hypothetical protein TFLX_02077 [Thermoflexales bacterium]